MTLPDLLIFLVIPLGIFFLLAVVIVFHLKNYRLEGDFSVKALEVFLAVSGVMILAIIFTFFSIDWNVLSPSDFFENIRGVSSSQY